MTSRPRILVVDDERAIQTLLSYPLEGEGFEVVQALSGETALERFDDTISLVLLDVSLPGIDGFEVCRRLRADGSPVPIIMLTARTDEIDTVLGLELGADDYVTKPFSIRELTSRVRAALRRSEMLAKAAAATPAEPEAERLVVGDLSVDLAGRSVRVRGEEVRLTFSEFEIVALMASSPGRVFTRDQLLEQVWGDAEYRDPRTVDVHVRHLREKLEAEPSEPELLLTVRGVGYQIGKP
ncbi:MAG: response regulator transcription factor [Solirubrobacteraceae bacterium]|nr:response regulator transcription factor [Solirubrobacteraceae bacterium]